MCCCFIYQGFLDSGPRHDRTERPIENKTVLQLEFSNRLIALVCLLLMIITFLGTWSFKKPPKMCYNDEITSNYNKFDLSGKMTKFCYRCRVASSKIKMYFNLITLKIIHLKKN